MRRLREGRGIVPLKKLGGGDEIAFTPQYLQNVLQRDLQCKNEEE